MAKRTTKVYTGNYHWVKPTAFWGIIISGIAGLVTLIFKILIAAKLITGMGATASRVVSIMNLIANLALFVSVFLAAYDYSRGKSKTWRTIFWIFAILAFLSLLGFNIIGMIFGV